MRHHGGRLLSALGLLATLGLLLASCAPAAAPTAAPKVGTAAVKPAGESPVATAPVATPKPETDKPRYGGILNISHTNDPPTFDVHQESSIISLAVLSAPYNLMIQYDPLEHDKIIGDLAETWEVSNDGLLYTFHLRKNVKWHDGKPFTSEDAKFSLDRMVFPPKTVKAPRQPNFIAVDKFEAPDAYTVKAYMKYPSASFIPMLATGWMVVMPKHLIDEKGDMKKVVVGTGPFKEKKFTSGISYEWTKNPDYFIPGRPYLDGITFYIVKDRATRFAAFRSGQIKLYGIGESATVTQISSVEKEMPSAYVTRFMGFDSRDFDLNTTRPPFSDVRVRQAISLGLDRQAAVKALDEGDALVGGLMPPGKWSLPEEDLLKMPGFRQPKDPDREQAKKLLAEAGFPEGFKTTILVKNRDAEIAEFMQSQLATIGIKATIDVRDAADWQQRLDKLNYDTDALRASLKVDDPDDIARYHLSDAPQNYPHLYDKEVDDLFMKESRAMDPAERRQIVWELQRKLIQLAGRLKLDWFYYEMAINRDVRDFKPGPGTFSNNRYEVAWLAK